MQNPTKSVNTTRAYVSMYLPTTSSSTVLITPQGGQHLCDRSDNKPVRIIIWILSRREFFALIFPSRFIF